VSGITRDVNGFTINDNDTQFNPPAYYTVDEWHNAGYKVGLYNWYGPAPQQPNFGSLDVPLTYARTFFWLAQKYGADHWWMWIASYTADWNQRYAGPGTYRHPFWGSNKLLEWSWTGYESIPSISGWSFTQIWTTKDVIHGIDFLGGGRQGIIGRMRSESVRRGIQDHQYLHIADRLGVDMATIRYGIIGRGFNDWGDDTPPWPNDYTDMDRYPHWKERGYEYERGRRALIQAIITKLAE
jgi:hypothetical protein